MTTENHLQRAERAEAQVAELYDRVKELDNEVANATRITSISQDRYQKAEARVKELERLVADNEYWERRLQELNDSWSDRVEKLEAIVARLPLTADGVPMIFGTDYWFIFLFSSSFKYHVCRDRLDVLRNPNHEFGGDSIAYYSTEALAQKAADEANSQASDGVKAHWAAEQAAKKGNQQ